MITTLDNFTRAYITAALWSSTDDEGEPLDDTFSVGDLAPESVARIAADCARFQAENSDALAEAYASDGYADIFSRHSGDCEGGDIAALAGHDFWLTRNGHGCGFWDRNLGDLGDKLSDAARAFGERGLYVGDDGQLYLE